MRFFGEVWEEEVCTEQPRPEPTFVWYLPGQGLLSATLGSAYRSACLGVVGSKMFCCSVTLPKSNIAPRNNKPSQKEMSSSSHWCSGAMLVSRVVFKALPAFFLIGWYCFMCKLCFFGGRDFMEISTRRPPKGICVVSTIRRHYPQWVQVKNPPISSLIGCFCFFGYRTLWFHIENTSLTHGTVTNIFWWKFWWNHHIQQEEFVQRVPVSIAISDYWRVQPSYSRVVTVTTIFPQEGLNSGQLFFVRL